MKKSKILSVLISLVMLVSAFAMLGGIEAHAASVSKPTVTLSNASATSVKVTWCKATNAKKYTVYKSTSKSSGFKEIKTTTSTSFTSTGLTCGKTYYFKVKAINGSSSSTSAVKSIKVKPLQVKGLKIEKSCNSLKLSWAKQANITGYEVYSSSSKSGTYSKIATVTANSYKNAGLKLGTTRYYKVRAYKTVNGKKIFGSYSAIASGKTYTAHEPASSWIITKKPTCASTGTKTNTCAICNSKITVTVPKSDDHSYVASTVPATKQNCAYTRYTCSLCGDIYNTEIKAHKFTEDVTKPTCTKKGYTVFTCSRSNCGYEYKGNETKLIPHNYQEVSVKKTCTAEPITVNKCSVCSKYVAEDLTELDFTPIESNPDGHSFDKNQTVKTEEGYVVPICDVCKQKVTEATDYTCYIDLTNQTISVPATASYNEAGDKLDLTPDDKTKAYEITGTASDITIDVNADRNMEIKLNGVEITNASKDCFDIKNKSTETKVDSEGATVPVIPNVAISAKDGTENKLKATVSGNAIESSCNLELKGHGELVIDTVSTSISCTAKIEMKNLTLDINSKNRGIDTKSETKNDAGLIISTDYSNITINPNAVIKITSNDDGVRCKNMEITALGEGDIDSVVTITSTVGDGIQLEGKKGIAVNSGNITIKAGKYAFNCKATLVIFADGVSKENCKGTSGFSKA